MVRFKKLKFLRRAEEVKPPNDEPARLSSGPVSFCVPKLSLTDIRPVPVNRCMGDVSLPASVRFTARTHRSVSHGNPSAATESVERSLPSLSAVQESSPALSEAELNRRPPSPQPSSSPLEPNSTSRGVALRFSNHSFVDFPAPTSPESLSVILEKPGTPAGSLTEATVYSLARPAASFSPTHPFTTSACTSAEGWQEAEHSVKMIPTTRNSSSIKKSRDVCLHNGDKNELLLLFGKRLKEATYDTFNNAVNFIQHHVVQPTCSNDAQDTDTELVLYEDQTQCMHHSTRTATLNDDKSIRKTRRPVALPFLASSSIATAVHNSRDVPKNISSQTETQYEGHYRHRAAQPVHRRPFDYPHAKCGRSTVTLPHQSRNGEESPLLEGVKETLGYIGNNVGSWMYEMLLSNPVDTVSAEQRKQQKFVQKKCCSETAGAVQHLKRNRHSGRYEHENSRSSPIALPAIRSIETIRDLPSLSASPSHRVPDFSDGHRVRAVNRPNVLQGSNRCVQSEVSALTPTQRSERCEEQLLQEIMKRSYWNEPAIKPIKEKMAPPTVWQKLWHTLDPGTAEELKRRHRELVTRVGHRVITRQKWNTRLPDIPKAFWRNAAYSHLELTLFSIENVPYIAQVVVETGNLRFAMPFNCRFLRIPWLHEDQVITLWFNSPVGKSQRCAADPLIGLEELSNDWMGNAEDDDNLSQMEEGGVSGRYDKKHLENNCDEDAVGEEELQLLTDTKIHPRSRTFADAPQGQYTPSKDFRTFFRFDIPLASVKEEPDALIEDAALIDPKGAFYECNADHPPTDNFRLLREATQNVAREPTLKFRAKLYMQGPAYLLTTGDIGEDHLLRLPPCERDTHYLFKKLVYVANITDPLDHLVGELLNKHGQRLMRERGPDGIYRLCTGKYFIDHTEYDVVEAKVTPKQFPDFDFSAYPEVTGPMYAQGFSVPLVCTEDSYQPLLDFLLGTKKNQHWIAAEKKQLELRGVDIPGVPENCLPQLDDWSLIALPPELSSDPTTIKKLHQHGVAITLNVALRSIPACFAAPSLPAIYHNDLEPPLLQIGDGAASAVGQQRFTFLWGSEMQDHPPVVVPISYYQQGASTQFPPDFLIPFEGRAACLGAPFPDVMPHTTALPGAASWVKEFLPFSGTGTAVEHQRTASSTHRNGEYHDMVGLTHGAAQAPGETSSNVTPTLLSSLPTAENVTAVRSNSSYATATTGIPSQETLEGGCPDTVFCPSGEQKIHGRDGRSIPPKVPRLALKAQQRVLSEKGHKYSQLPVSQSDYNSQKPSNVDHGSSVVAASAPYNSTTHYSTTPPSTQEQQSLSSYETLKCSPTKGFEPLNHHSVTESSEPGKYPTTASLPYYTSPTSSPLPSVTYSDSTVESLTRHDSFEGQTGCASTNGACKTKTSVPFSPDIQRKMSNTILAGGENGVSRHCYPYQPSMSPAVDSQHKGDHRHDVNQKGEMYNVMPLEYEYPFQSILSPNAPEPVINDKDALRARLLEEQQINNVVYSRFTGQPLGYRTSVVSPLGEVILPDEPPLPPIEALEQMDSEQRLRLKALRTRMLSQQMLEHYQMEWFRSPTYTKIVSTLKECHLDR